MNRQEIILLLAAFLLIFLVSCGDQVPEETAQPSPTSTMTSRAEETTVAETPEPKPTNAPEDEEVELDGAAVDEIEATPTRQPSGLTAEIVSGNFAGVGKPFTFDGTQSQAGGVPIVDYVWSMGDGTTLFGLAVEHAFNEPGFYTITLIITDEDGKTDTTTKVVEVVPLEDLETPTAVPEDPAIALVGTFWAMNNPVRGTTVTMAFGEGTISGSAGCNDYSANFTISEAEGASANISVSSISSAGQSCTQEIMAQERGFLDSLASAQSFAIDGDTLTMETGGGTLTFSAIEVIE